jgi:hypothetical protein
MRSCLLWLTPAATIPAHIINIGTMYTNSMLRTVQERSYDANLSNDAPRIMAMGEAQCPFCW